MGERPQPRLVKKKASKKTLASSHVSVRYMRDRWKRFIDQDSRGMMQIDGVPVDKIVAKYGTPLYVMSESEIRSRMRRWKKTVNNRIELQYCVKTNSNLQILRIANEEGFGLDCSSIGEVILGLLADFKPKQLTFTNLNKSQQDIYFAAKIGVQAITADSFEDLEHIAMTAKKLRKHVDTVIRVNPMVTVGSYSTRGNKYGIPIGHVVRAVEIARRAPYVDFTGFHFMGGYVYQARVFKAVARVFAKLIRQCEDRGIPIRSVSLGGGFPAAIGDEYAFPIEEMKDFPGYWDRLMRRHGITTIPRLIFEPGKSIVMNAGVGLMKVVSKKRLGLRHRMVVCDGSTYNFVPDFYTLLDGKTKYDILPASKMNDRRIHTVTIGGNTCDCWDLIVKDTPMPKLRAGDILAAMDVGGYAQVMANNFNTIRRAAVVLVHPDGTLKLIRRRDRYSEMFAPELDVLKMAGPDELEKYHNLYRVNIDKIWKGKQKKNGNGNGHGNGSSASKAFRQIAGDTSEQPDTHEPRRKKKA
jgi:diaminopimelate decarboxylase